MSECHRIQSLIPSAAEGELDEGLRAKIADHTETCPACAAAWEFQSRLRTAVEDDPMASPPPLYFEGVLAEIHRRLPAALPVPRMRSWRLRFRRETLATALTGALLLIWFGAGAGPGLWQSSGPSRRAAQAPAIAGAGQQMVEAASRQVASAVVWVEGVGLSSAETARQFMKMPAALRGELLLKTTDEQASLARMVFRG